MRHMYLCIQRHHTSKKICHVFGNYLVYMYIFSLLNEKRYTIFSLQNRKIKTRIQKLYALMW